MSRFIQIHALTSYPGVLLNRDDAGFAKRLPFGGVTRTRVSSQCLKRHWRRHDGEHSLVELGEPRSVRSRRTFDLKILQPLIAEGYPTALTTRVVEELIAEVVGKADAKSEEEGAVRTSQVTVLGQPEVDYLYKQTRTFLDTLRADVSHLWSADATLSKDDDKSLKEQFKKQFDKDLKANLKGLRLAAGLDAAMFGRMVTSDVLARGDAAIHVAHAFTVHAEESESDYFSAIDDLVAETGELGSGHINSSELTSGLFYSYVVVDVPLLVSNIGGVEHDAGANQDLAGRVVENLVQIIATVSPGAKLGATAPYAYAQTMLIESGSAQPRTLANAFQRPVQGRDVLRASYDALSAHIGDLDRTYGRSTNRKIAAMGPKEQLCSTLDLAAEPVATLAAWARQQVGEGA